jgi:hypothetical protein
VAKASCGLAEKVLGNPFPTALREGFDNHPQKKRISLGKAADKFSPKAGWEPLGICPGIPFADSRFW